MISPLASSYASPQNTFAEDVELLNKIEGFEVLKNGDSQIALVGRFQGRVFTSASKGPDGTSYGWFNREKIADDEYHESYASLGGEERMWFGPEFGKYSVCFKPGFEQIPENVSRSEDLDKLDFKKIAQTSNSVTYGNAMSILNHFNTEFKIDIERTITLFSQEDVESALDLKLPEGVTQVAFEAKTQMKNIGQSKWSKETGLLSIWDLGCMVPSPKTTVIIPTRGQIDAVTEYFTPLDESRITIKNGVVFYKADADYLNKIGTLPENTTPFFGSYNPELKLLTIIHFNFEDEPLYVNSHWVDQSDPYGGDVINVFNDGVLGDAGPFGPFFELETSSSARELDVGESHHHTHTTYHFEGSREQLNPIALKVLGTDLETTETAFDK